MSADIDCLLIGHNEMDFSEYEKSAREMGVNSGAYRDLNLNFIQYNNHPYTASEIFNLFYCSDDRSTGLNEPLSLTETFNAAVAYLGTYLSRRGLTFDYVNGFREEKEELKQKLQADNILTVAVITTLYVSVLPILEIVEYIRKYNGRVRIIVGGPFISTQVRTQNTDTLDFLFRSVGADFYVNSAQGEAALVNIIQALKNNTSPAGIKNIYYKNGGGYSGTPIAVEDNRLSENMVDWNLFADRIGTYLNLRTAISCPFCCSFCGFPQHAGKYQTAGVEDVERELDSLRKTGPGKVLHFIDDTFNVPKKRFREILEMMIKKNYGFKWYSHYRCQFADRDTIALMKESGCEGVFLGIESGNDQILQNMKKAADVEKYAEGIALLKEAGILTYGSFIIGFPGETEETVADTLQFIKNSEFDFYRAQLWYCEPITPIWKEREKYKLSGESFEWSHATMNSRQASDLIEEIFFAVENAAWVPQYNFEFDSLFHLLHRGKSMEQVKAFLNAFNNGIKEKLRNPGQKEVGFDVIRQIKDTCRETPETGTNGDTGKKTFNKCEADFDF